MLSFQPFFYFSSSSTKYWLRSMELTNHPWDFGQVAGPACDEMDETVWTMRWCTHPWMRILHNGVAWQTGRIRVHIPNYYTKNMINVWQTKIAFFGWLPRRSLKTYIRAYISCMVAMHGLIVTLHTENLRHGTIYISTSKKLRSLNSGEVVNFT